ncbi:hypothetical protein EXS70_05180 [Candidatus Peribacteria bacterium]|nr:hypothetical protein [Candidatus Peribacteria bacterium]
MIRLQNDNICQRLSIDCPNGESPRCTDVCGVSGCSGQCCVCTGSSSSRYSSYASYSSYPSYSSARYSSVSYSSVRNSSSSSFQYCRNGYSCTADVQGGSCARITVNCPTGMRSQCSDACGVSGCGGQCCVCVGGSSSLRFSSVAFSSGQRVFSRSSSQMPFCVQYPEQCPDKCPNGVCSNLENGQFCTGSTQCSSSLCRNGVCVACNLPTECAPGQVCFERSCVTPQSVQESTPAISGACGNGVVDADEECDRGVDNSDILADACRTDCRNAFCGDGIADRNEQCDDGNTVSGDGCDRLCRIEVQDFSQLPNPSDSANVITTGRPPAGKTGPAAIAIMAAGGAAGWAMIGRRKRKS